MKFEEVLPALREGKVVRRASWRNWAIRLKDGFTYEVLRIENQWVDTANVFGVLFMAEVYADNWEVME